VISKWIDEDLRFVLQSPKRFAVQNSVAVALKAGSHRIFFLRAPTACAFCRQCRPRAQMLRFSLFNALADVAQHEELDESTAWFAAPEPITEQG
jgi:hypothetical protein